MYTLNVYPFYELGAKLHALFSVSAQNRVADMFVPLTEAQTLLDGLIKGDFLTLETSKTDATRLLNKIGALFNRYYIDPATKQLKPVTGEDRIDAHEMSLISTLVDKFEHALAAELSRTPTYVASKRGIYSIFDLAERSQNIFGDEIRKCIPSASQQEFNLAGRSIAFSLGTGAVLHLLRATEIMVRSYYESFGGPALAKNERNFTIYLKKLAALSEDDDRQSNRPDKRVVQLLSQIKDHYRNPLLAADSSVTMDEAMQLFGMASAIISLMAEQIQARQKTERKSDTTKSDGTPSTPNLSSLAEEGEIYDYPLSQAG